MLRVVLVGPKTPGNVGAVARAMANFGVRSLRLVDPCELTDEAWERALHAHPILREATEHASFEDALAGVDLAVGFTSEHAEHGRHHLRQALALDDVAARLADVEGDVALVFGREDDGLRNEELARCEVVATIPTNPGYASMNLSHAVAVALYALRVGRFEPREPRSMAGSDRAVLFDTFDAVMEAIELPEHRREHTRTCFRRVVGRAMPSTWEYHRLMGVLSGVLKALDAAPDEVEGGSGG